jgi:hypothetical protein
VLPPCWRGKLERGAALPKDKRQTEKQVATFAKKAAQENDFQHSRRDPYQKVMGWLLPRAGKS